MITTIITNTNIHSSELCSRHQVASGVAKQDLIEIGLTMGQVAVVVAVVVVVLVVLVVVVVEMVVVINMGSQIPTTIMLLFDNHHHHQLLQAHNQYFRHRPSNSLPFSLKMV
jgi:hypothetical protein